MGTEEISAYCQILLLWYCTYVKVIDQLKYVQTNGIKLLHLFLLDFTNDELYSYCVTSLQYFILLM